MPFLALIAAVALVAVLASKGGGASHGASDDTMPPQIAGAVHNALTRTPVEPANLHGFADAIEPFYPHAAMTLRERAKQS